MSRRLTNLLIVWLALFSVIAPAITCAAATTQGDCCPLKGPAPCGECPAKPARTVPAPAHCVVAPVQATATITVSQTATERGVYPDVPVAAIVAHPPAPDSHLRAKSSPRPEPAACFACGAAPTYLVTGRLRL